MTSTVQQRTALAVIGGDRPYFGAMAAIFGLTTIVGFARTYYFKAFTDAPALTNLVEWHAVVFTLWPALLIVQTVLAANGRIRTHRALGIAGGVLAVLMVVIGVLASIEGARLGHRGNGPVQMPDALMFLAVPVRDLVVFAALTGAALCLRRRPAAHKRLMLLGTLGGLLPAPVGRLQNLGPAFAIGGVVFALVLLLSGPVYDWVTTRRVHVAYLAGLPFVLLVDGLTRPVAYSAWWRACAEWLIR